MLKFKIPKTIQRFIAYVNTFLNNTAMYRLVLYVLMSYVAVAFIFSFLGTFGLIPFTPLDMLLSLIVILGVSWITNIVFAKVFNAPTNVESIYITALILFCIITPPHHGYYAEYFSLAIWASVWAMASKYIFAIGKKHIFNPAALALVITALTIHQVGNWWIGRGDMLPFVLLGGILIVMKIRRFDMVLSFAVSALATICTIALLKGSDVAATLGTTFTDTAFLFFAFIMLTEPLTAPPTKRLRIAYGVLVGFLFAPNLHFGSFYSTPELALVLGNIFSYVVSPKGKYVLKLKERIQTARDTFDYVFTSDRTLSFKPGQYMEWTLLHDQIDSRGNRRYFTLASSPTENEVHLGVRQYSKSSSFKTSLQEMEMGSKIVASQLAGDFVLPNDPKEKLAFIAGGIGITPFRSMVQHMLDTKEKRTVTLFYSNRSQQYIAYKDVFDKANVEFGMKTIYVCTDSQGMISAGLIQKEVADYIDRTFYISGPNAMVSSFKSILKSLGISSKRIKTDYFPGL